MQVGILGPLEVRHESGRVVDVTGARLRALLVRLALDAGSPVSNGALAEAVWGEGQPADVANALQTLVSRLRRTLGDPGSVAQSAAGYRLATPKASVDACRFERLAADGAARLAAGDAAGAEAALADALGLWRGAALEDGGDSVAADAARLGELRVSALIDLTTARLRLGRGGGSVAQLEALLADRPLDERLAGVLMNALAASGRQAEALALFERTRVRLADELGVDPSAALREAHLDVLRGSDEPEHPAPQRRTNLKAQLTSFVGRDEDVARIQKSLELNRLVTLVGPGGAGKTRLASEAVAGVLDETPDGVWFVELASVNDAGDIAQTVLGSLGLRDIHLLDTRTTQLSARDVLTRLSDALAGKRTVLVLDNCEHLIEGCARIADHLLGQSPDLRIVATSREPLGIIGEALLAVTPLGRPRPDVTAADALEYPAVQLFADRAAAVDPDFAVDDTNAATVIDIVGRLDGLPLAIELAAARLRTLPLDEISARLSDRFRLLTGGSRTALPRHRTLRAVVEWSWELLTPSERLLAERLSVFPAGATNESAAAICGDDTVLEADVADLLGSLVDKSLLQRVGGGDRLRMLETIREYGIERLAERGELHEVRNRHAAYFAELIKRVDAHIRTADQLPWMRLIDVERDNVLAALRHLVDVGDAQAALEIAAGAGGYWMFTGAHAEAATWLSHALEAEGEADEDLRLLATSMLVMTSSAGMGPSDAATLERGMAWLRELNVQFAAADVDRHPMLAVMRPVIAMFSDDPDAVEASIELAQASSDPWVRASGHMIAANVAENSGDIERMRESVDLALAEFQRIGERWGLASCLQMSGQLRMLEDDLAGASADYRRSMDLVAELGTHDDEAWLYLRVADVELRLGNTDEAVRMADRARELAEASGAPWLGLFGEIVQADLAMRRGDVGEARRIRQHAIDRLDTLPAVHPLQGHAVAIVWGTSARHELVDGDPELGRSYLSRAAHISVGTRDQPIVAAVAMTCAAYLHHDGDPRRAAELLGVAHLLRGAAERTHPDYIQLSAALRAELGDAAFEIAYAHGQQLEREAAIELLLRASGASSASTVGT